MVTRAGDGITILPKFALNQPEDPTQPSPSSTGYFEKGCMMAIRIPSSRWAVVLAMAAFVALLAARPASAQLQFSSADGKQSFKIGILGQLQGESIENADAKADSANNLFLRRIRLLGNFKLSDDLTVFFDTDAPNLGKGNPDGSKNNADLFLQDVIVTYSFSKAFQIDGGLLLMAQSYNHNQSAATLMTVDYGPYTFIESTPTTSRTGRDYGVQARGYLGDDHLEYRAGRLPGRTGGEQHQLVPLRGAPRLLRLRSRDHLFLPRHLARQDADAIDRRQLRRAEGPQVLRRRPVLGSARGRR